jgi:hypothetical protein
MNELQVTACILCSRGRDALPTIIGVANQSIPPTRILICNMEKEDITNDRLVGGIIDFIDADVIYADKSIRESPPSYENYANGCNYIMDNVRTPWAWMIDDDVYPQYDCLENLLITQRNTKGYLISAAQKDIIPFPEPWGMHCFNRNLDRRDRDIKILWPASGNVLYNTSMWKSIDTSVPEGEFLRGGSDVIFGVQYAFSIHGAFTSSKALGYHLRRQPPSWYKDSNSWDWCKKHFKRVLKAQDYDYLMTILDVKGEIKHEE